jgi:hypothetical protein
MSWYRASTISVTNGSTAVTGAATDFIANAAIGEGLLAPDGKVYEIAAIVSATALTLGSAYLGSTASGQSYAIIPSQSYLRDLALQAAALVNDYQSVLDSAGAGKFGDGTLGSPGIQFSSDSNTGLRRTGTDAVALVTGGVDRITVDAAGAVAVVASLSVAGSAVPTLTSTSTLTNKTLALGGNTISGTTAQFNTALTDGDFATLAGTETLTNKTLTSPAINGGVIDTTSTTATAALGTSSTRLANTAFVQQEKEYLPALSQSLHIGAIVKAIVYDTSADSDGGAWRKRCADKSWYTETLGGDRWIGQHATIAAAWTAAGSTTGAVFQASATAGAQTIGKYYTPTSSTTVTEVFRGVSREFPAVVGIVAESARVVIYDLSAVGCPMWMVFNTSYSTNPRLLIGTANTSVVAGQGKVFLGGGAFGVTIADFVADNGTRINATATYRFPALIAARNTEYSWPSLSSVVLVNSTVNDVALTVLDSSPVDPATRLPVPTIAVATAGGVSVILDSGTVVNGGTLTDYKHVHITPQFDLICDQGSGSSAVRISRSIGSLTAGFTQPPTYYSGSIPSVFATGSPTALASPSKSLAIGETMGLVLVKENPTTTAKSMTCAITTAYNSGHMVGDIRGAYLADTTAETVTASGELVTNGTFTTDTTGWTAYQNGVLSVDTARLLITNGAADSGAAYQTITTVADKTYVFSITITEGTSATSIVRVGAGSGAAVSSYVNATNLGDGVFTYTFTATSTVTTITVYVGTITLGHTVYFDNISVKLADPDRSVKNKGLVINGSLTKTAVASGAGLVAWSGFSGSNYLEQPYNSDLDFGTGDFCVMGWVNVTSTAATQAFFGRGTTGAGALALYFLSATWRIVCSATEANVNTAVTANTGLQHVALFRASGNIYLYVNGVQVYTAANTANITNAAAKLVVGAYFDYSSSAANCSLALWRITATAPSADQIAHIYRTELPLFQASAQCTIAGSSAAVTALAFDDTSELLHVGTSWGRTGFKDLLRVDSEATTTGALTSLSASQGVIITGGTSGKVYVPAMLLRDELRRKDEARKALGKVPVFFDYTATASQTAFVAPKGYTIKAVYHNGTLKRETTTGVYWTRSTDGFAETCTLSAGATVSDWISLMCVRT